ncbi:hypothetical protein [uncultured Kriegella sp.]|uniref:hypothetical protein n=1 Tax=uncultured Kriegella sp. TaxID=1798910 RepID=UPI0030D70585|tara:strand:- start:166814 stop:167995 length:1182 start_codon:yes stop_codon:yes gene_type:complete
MFRWVKIRSTAIFNWFTRTTVYVKIATVLAALSFANAESIKYFQPQTILLQPHSTQAYQVDMNDAISESNSLFKVSAKDATPIYFYREVFTPVCFDNKCRPLTINLFWNITGRYLGFELPEGEFLSKTDHDPFSVDEYEKLNQILATERTPLADINYNQLTVESNSHGLGDIDAISAATPQNLAPYVIDGAAYTTFKLWHLIHGTTRNQVQKLTIQDISPELILKILESPVQADKIWALEHIDGHVGFTSDLKEKVFDLIKGENYLIVEKALSAIHKTELDSLNVQQLLMKALIQENYNVQIRVIDKIGECNALKESVKMHLVENLGSLNGQVFKKALTVLAEQELTAEMYFKIAVFLKSENAFISNSIAAFLKSEHITDPQILALLKKNGNE